MSDKSAGMDSKRVIRVFVSSTFLDMREERGELVRNIFPRLRKICERRGIVWGEVDLRWGITDEETAEGKVLPICLEEIKRCRPYFIGILGERYGWVPFEISRGLIESEKWLKEHQEKSVTELEILHGVLNDPGMSDHAYFYFRDPHWAHSRPERQRAEYLEGPTADELKNLDSRAAEQHAEMRRQKLSFLKDRIRSSGFPVKENFLNPKQLGELVLADFTDLIDRLFPEGSEPDLLDRDASEHDAYGYSRFSAYIGKQEYYDRLNSHVFSDSQPLAILGESGSGKSALLANWSEKFKKEHPDEFLIRHFIGANPRSTDWAAMLRRIMGEMKRRLDIRGDIPAETRQLRTAFASWLHMAAAKGRMILVLDALNQLEDRDGALDLLWLPPFIPANVRLFISTLPGRPLDEIKKRDWPTIKVELLNIETRKRLISDYLADYGKKMSKAQAARIADTRQTSNPLYMRVLLEELRLVGEYERLDTQIEGYLNAATIPDLLIKVFERYEDDYDHERPGLVRDAMSAIWASRQGLAESELQSILGSKENPVPQALWAPLNLAAERLLTSRSGLINFAHDYVRQAVKSRYVPLKEDEAAWHLRLANYFAAEEVGHRKLDELPWQLAEASEWKRLSELLSRLDFFEAAWKRDQFEVRKCWAKVESNSPFKAPDAYASIVSNPSSCENPDILMSLALLFTEFGKQQEAHALLSALADYARKIGDMKNLGKALARLAWTYHLRGDYDNAMKLYEEEEQVARKAEDRVEIARALGGQATALFRRGDFDGALKLHAEAEHVFREAGENIGLATALFSQGNIVHQRGDAENALRLWKEAERVFREAGDLGRLQTAIGNQGLVLFDRGDLEGALKVYREQERICRELGESDSLGRSLSNQATALSIRGDMDEAMRLHREAEAIARATGNRSNLVLTLDNQAFIAHTQGHLDRALELYKEKEQICREISDLRGLTSSLSNQGSIVHYRGDPAGSIKYFDEVERISREIGYPLGLYGALSNKAPALADLGDTDNAVALINEAESICRAHNMAVELVYCLRRRVHIFKVKGDYKEALASAEEVYRLATEHGSTLIAEEVQGEIDEIKTLMDNKEE